MKKRLIIGKEIGIINGKTEIKLLPGKIVAVGLNYRDHAAELKMALPSDPVIFLKPNTSVIGNKEDIIIPSMSKHVDYEAELAVVIRDKCRDVDEKDAGRHILGYTCANDVTARDLQKIDGQWTRSKSFDTFCPLGPVVVDDIDVSDLNIRLILNGRVKQDSSTSNMIFGVSKIVSFISRIMTLMPGDVILTGTPVGVGKINAGDIVEVEIEGIGKLTNKVSAERK